MLKSIYVSAYMTSAMVIAGYAIHAMWGDHDVLTWGGVLLATAPFLAVVGRWMILRDVARTSSRLPAITLLGVIGVAMAGWGAAQGGSPVALVLAATCWVGFLVYAFWYSSFGRQHSAALTVGELAPVFELTDVGGNSVLSTSLMDTRTVWIFYRGNWCPLCMAQIREVADQYRQLQELGVRVALVSPQPQGHTASLARKFDVPFEFLVDAGNRAARALGIAIAHGIPAGMQALGYASETVLPTVMITDVGGRILWVHETDNYRVRPEPEVFLNVLREQATE